MEMSAENCSEGGKYMRGWLRCVASCVASFVISILVLALWKVNGYSCVLGNLNGEEKLYIHCLVPFFLVDSKLRTSKHKIVAFRGCIFSYICCIFNDFQKERFYLTASTSILVVLLQLWVLLHMTRPRSPRPAVNRSVSILTHRGKKSDAKQMTLERWRKENSAVMPHISV